MDIGKLISEIIPPSDYQHRNGFSNIDLIDKLGVQERLQVEDSLIYKLLFESDPKKGIDPLIIETLGYLKSEKSISILKELLANSGNEMEKLIIATSIYEITSEE